MLRNSIFHSGPCRKRGKLPLDSVQLQLVRTCFNGVTADNASGFQRSSRSFFVDFSKQSLVRGSTMKFGEEETAEIWDLVGKECKSSLPPGTRINSIPRWIRESVPRKYEIGEHKFVRIYGRPRTNVSTSGRVLPALGPPSTSESISQVLHPPSKGTLPPLDRNFPRYAFIISFSLSFSKFHRSLSRLLSRTKRCNNRICECEYSISTIRV